MLKKIGIGLAVVIVALVAVIATRPATFHVERSTTISAPADIAYTQVADFHNWKGWSPWDKLDPNQKTTFTGTPGVVGSTYAWEGNDKVGAGKMTILAVKPNEEVQIKLDFLKPFESTSTTTFSFKPEGQGTKVTWSMAGDNNFAAKAMQLVMSMDSMIGKDFENGLTAMRTVSEGEAKKRAEAEAAAAKAKAEAEAKAAAEAEAAKAAEGTPSEGQKVAEPAKP